MVCLREYDFDILQKNTTLQECESFIKDLTEDTYLVPGGYKVKGVTLWVQLPPLASQGMILYSDIQSLASVFLH